MGSEIKQDIAEVAKHNRVVVVASESPSSKMLESSERPKENRRTGSTLAQRARARARIFDVKVSDSKTKRPDASLESSPDASNVHLDVELGVAERSCRRGGTGNANDAPYSDVARGADWASRRRKRTRAAGGAAWGPRRTPKAEAADSRAQHAPGSGDFL
ncbi:hypothetical protein FB451DRAFT_1166142 [Mycena latifolia]|nr:hypothetical protein FB451DRAFT_1166142 [Mycena latifolia]